MRQTITVAGEPLILVIDDDDGVRTSLALLLRARGYAVATASDGAEGLLKFQHLHPRLVVTDMVMPGNSGIGMIDEIRQSDSDALIVAMSGTLDASNSNGSFVDKAMQAGANTYLSKPFEAQEMLDALAALMDGSPLH